MSLSRRSLLDITLRMVTLDHLALWYFKLLQLTTLTLGSLMEFCSDLVCFLGPKALNIFFFHPEANPEADSLLQRGDWNWSPQRIFTIPQKGYPYCFVFRPAILLQTWWLKITEFILSQPWRLQVWKQGVRRVIIPLKPPGKTLSGLFLALGGSWQFLAFNVFELLPLFLVSASMFRWPSSLYVYLCPFIFW